MTTAQESSSRIFSAVMPSIFSILTSITQRSGSNEGKLHSFFTVRSLITISNAPLSVSTISGGLVLHPPQQVPVAARASSLMSSSLSDSLSQALVISYPCAALACCPDPTGEAVIQTGLLWVRIPLRGTRMSRSTPCGRAFGTFLAGSCGLALPYNKDCQ